MAGRMLTNYIDDAPNPTTQIPVIGNGNPSPQILTLVHREQPGNPVEDLSEIASCDDASTATAHSHGTGDFCSLILDGDTRSLINRPVRFQTTLFNGRFSVTFLTV